MLLKCLNTRHADNGSSAALPDVTILIKDGMTTSSVHLIHLVSGGGAHIYNEAFLSFSNSGVMGTVFKADRNKRKATLNHINSTAQRLINPRRTSL